MRYYIPQGAKMIKTKREMIEITAEMVEVYEIDAESYTVAIKAMGPRVKVETRPYGINIDGGKVSLGIPRRDWRQA